MDPSLLVHLAPSPTGPRPCFTYFAVLPRSLLVLDTKLVINARDTDLVLDASFFADPPPHLHTITMIEHLFVQLENSWLPRSLVHCDLKPLFYAGERPPTRPEWFTQRPPALETLTISPEDCLDNFSSTASHWAEIFPPNLLKLSSYRSDMNVVASLPASLTHVLLSSARFGDAEFDLLCNIEWPPLLSTLEIGLIPNSVLWSLPSTLTSLSVGWGSDGPFPSAALPRGILKLTLHWHGEEDQILVIEPNLPSVLECLSLHNVAMTFLDCASLVLPPFLKSFQSCSIWNRATTRLSHIISLPSSLTSLKTEIWDANDPIPPSLTMLDTDVLLVDSKHGCCIDWTAAMPTSIERLIIMKLKTKAITHPPTLFMTLKNLKVLSMHDSTLEFDAILLKNLPPTVSSCGIPLANFPKSCTTDLNPFWKYLRLYLTDSGDQKRAAKAWPPESVVDRNVESIAAKSRKYAINRAYCYPDPRAIIDLKPMNNTIGRKKNTKSTKRSKK